MDLIDLSLLMGFSVALSSGTGVLILCVLKNLSKIDKSINKVIVIHLYHGIFLRTQSTYL